MFEKIGSDRLDFIILITNMNKITKNDIRRFGEKAFTSIEKNYSCGYKTAYLIARIMKNDSYYRFRFYKAFRKYETARNLFSKVIQYRRYSKYGHIIKAQIICKHIGTGFYFEHGNIVINKDSYLGDNVLLIGNNCIGGGNNGAPSIGNNVKIGWGGSIIGGVKVANNSIIGAHTIITKDISETGTYVGVNKKIK